MNVWENDAILPLETLQTCLAAEEWEGDAEEVEEGGGPTHGCGYPAADVP